MWPKLVYNLPGLKYITGAFPKFYSKYVTNVVEQAMVVNVGSDGKMLRGFNDPTGNVMKFVTSAVEFEGHLYILLKIIPRLVRFSIENLHSYFTLFINKKDVV
ncbi:hypothetical protein SASPL_129704 [Salvia splendens]|uniref:Strictosidine synthase n=1 Tax=Salvia splendens TaxID=180675 RepID=A0A8X8XD74_SALSN|nr:hypothetical protein SASPL_129704 [Salvia splendens]